ncbi:hypothetical protein [Massilia cavernae]|uniref:Uncharacterized protein n=1 Tax=Massilia cavernae TaxID=2320864 RepID=A0A418XPU8_9BURK|nr:hypothetical protein [Massilia cavernae]RJG14457.1 hypothetical protein D3872_17735 [Massilia cavernae]
MMAEMDFLNQYFRMKNTFTPIAMSAYLEKYLQSNPGMKRAQAQSRLEDAIAAHRKGMRCACGAAIWVIGSAEVGLGCFSCITGAASPGGDYEIAGID